MNSKLRVHVNCSATIGNNQQMRKHREATGQSPPPEKSTEITNLSQMATSCEVSKESGSLLECFSESKTSVKDFEKS